MQGLDIIFNYDILRRLWQGLIITLEISFISIVISIFCGLIMGILMSLKNKFIYIICKICLEIVRVMPIIVWLFLVYFGLSKMLNLHLSAFMASLIVFSIWGTFEMMDLVRGAVSSIPAYQFESAYSLCLNKFQTYKYVIVPLAMRRLVPSSINLLSRMIKTTPVVILIGVVELLKVGQEIIENYVFSNNMAPFFVYSFIFFIYFIICYPISRFSKKLEKRWEN